MLEQTGMCQFWSESPMAFLIPNKKKQFGKNIEIARLMSETGCIQVFSVKRLTETLKTLGYCVTDLPYPSFQFICGSTILGLRNEPGPRQKV